MSVKAFPQIQQSPSGYALPGAKRFLTESLGFQFYEHSVKLPKPDGHKQKQVKRASDQMRFDGGVSLLFHIAFPAG